MSYSRKPPLIKFNSPPQLIIQYQCLTPFYCLFAATTSKLFFYLNCLEVLRECFNTQYPLDYSNTLLYSNYKYKKYYTRGDFVQGDIILIPLTFDLVMTSSLLYFLHDTLLYNYIYVLFNLAERGWENISKLKYILWDGFWLKQKVCKRY